MVGGGMAQQGVQGVDGEQGTVARPGLEGAREPSGPAGQVGEAVQAEGCGASGAQHGPFVGWWSSPMISRGPPGDLRGRSRVTTRVLEAT